MTSVRLSLRWTVALLVALLTALSVGTAVAAPSPSPKPNPSVPAGGDKNPTVAPTDLAQPTVTSSTGQTVTLSAQQAKPGSYVRVSGAGWSPGSLVQISICGRQGKGGSGDCALQDGVSVPVGQDGKVALSLPVVVPPTPCPCSVRVVTVTGGKAQQADIDIVVVGARYEPVPAGVAGPGHLAFLDSKMTGSDSVFTKFGSPVSRQFEIKVGNMGASPVVNPVFQLGFFEGVYAPKWEDLKWKGTINPGERKTIKLSVSLKARQHGDFVYRLNYEGQMVVESPLHVGRPWGVYVFIGLLLTVIPLLLWRLTVAVLHVVRDRKQGPQPEEKSPVVDLQKKKKTPVVEETVVVSGPLFAEPEDSAEPKRRFKVPKLNRKPAAEDPPTALLEPVADEKPAVKPEQKPEAKVPAPVAPEASTDSDGRLVDPADIMRSLAWNTAGPEGDGAAPGGRD
jgi:hypothetical protein